ncbi:hypothetical protein EVAR_9110_1 [Eumeta japonica]|uniref:Uncharacterized protein n=1 Tax=Eumeta variegata TaxID=151549 RepID=A0A4C1TW86_EUMVA|nr:hypothetical protein EVAR_9110_1 [Eumeta japonica]
MDFLLNQSSYFNQLSSPYECQVYHVYVIIIILRGRTKFPRKIHRKLFNVHVIKIVHTTSVSAPHLDGGHSVSNLNVYEAITQTTQHVAGQRRLPAAGPPRIRRGRAGPNLSLASANAPPDTRNEYYNGAVLGFRQFAGVTAERAASTARGNEI